MTDANTTDKKKPLSEEDKARFLLLRDELKKMGFKNIPETEVLNAFVSDVQSLIAKELLTLVKEYTGPVDGPNAADRGLMYAFLGLETAHVTTNEIRRETRGMIEINSLLDKIKGAFKR